MPDFSKFNAMTLVTMRPAWDKGVPFVVRALICRAPLDLLTKPAIQGVARAMAGALGRKWESYDVIGVTVTKPPQGLTLNGSTTEADCYVADCVFMLRTVNIKKPLNVSEQDLADEIRNQLTTQRINSTIVTVVGVAEFNPTDPAAWANYLFWSKRISMFEWNGKEAQTTTAFDAGLHRKGFGPDNLSFSQGLADEPGYLQPFPITMWDSGTGPVPLPEPNPPGISLPLSLGGAPVTVSHVAIAGLFALVGWKIYGLFSGGTR